MNTKTAIEKLYKETWHNKYLCKLAILDHLRECLEKDNYLKARDVDKKSKEYQLLDKELMDLKIILDFYFKNNDELYNSRINKFIQKIKNDNK